MALKMANARRQAGAVPFAAALVAAAVAAGALRVISHDGLSVRTHLTDSPSRVPVVEVTSGGARSQRPVALLVHGFQCNKSMMMPLAKHLAAAGLDAYAIDLPGHGASLERFSEERARAATREALDAILATRGPETPRVVLIGHSYGANVLARIAEGVRPRAMVMLGPSYGGGLSRGSEGDLLVLTAEREPPRIQAFARDLMRDATGGALDAAGELGGDASRGKRAWLVVPSTDHVSLVFSADALQRTSTWIAASVQVAPGAGGSGASPAIAFAVLALAAAVALARTATATWSSTWVVETEAPARLPGPGWMAAVCSIALAVAVLLGRRVTVLGPLRLLEGERIASLLAVAGASMAVLAVLGRRRVPWPSPAQVARGAPVAAAALALVYAAADLSVDGGLYRLSLAGIAPERWSAAIVLTAALSPFFAFSGALLEGVRGARGALWAGAATVALCAAVSAAVQVLDPQLGRFAVPMGAVCLFAVAVGAVLSRAARNPAVGALFSSAVTAWLFAVGFARY